MTQSMTAFARSHVRGGWGELTWEVRSVNHRFLDLTPRLPDALKGLDAKVRELAAHYIARGKVDLIARLDLNNDSHAIEIDPARLTAVGEALDEVRSRVIDCRAPDALEILEYPGVQCEVEPDIETVHAAALDSLQTALAELVEMRRAEGQRLGRVLSERAQSIAAYADAAGERVPHVKQALEDKLRARLAQIDANADPARLEQELVLNAQKMDVSEELDRLHSHIAALSQALEKTEPVGRRLDFLMQEFNREANTLSSKSQDAALTGHAVEIKVLIEQMREQVQNIQ